MKQAESTKSFQKSNKKFFKIKRKMKKMEFDKSNPHMNPEIAETWITWREKCGVLRLSSLSLSNWIESVPSPDLWTIYHPSIHPFYLMAFNEYHIMS